MKPRIIFIHGMFQNSKSWAHSHWGAHFENLGFEVEAPSWPLHHGEPVDLRTDIPAGLGSLTLAQVYDHYREIVCRQAERPIVIGHSLGGLIAQKLLGEGLVRAAVGIAPVAPNRMLAMDWGFMRNNASIINPFAGNDPYEMTPELFHKNFANTLSRDESDVAWNACVVHEGRQVLRDILGEDGEIDVTRPHHPLLLIGAEKDEIIPPSLVRRNADAYEDEGSRHEYQEFAGRGHFICGEPGWEEVATAISTWLDGVINPGTTTGRGPQDNALVTTGDAPPAIVPLA